MACVFLLVLCVWFVRACDAESNLHRSIQSIGACKPSWPFLAKIVERGAAKALLKEIWSVMHVRVV